MPPSKFMRLNNPLSPNCSFIDPSIHSYLPGSSEGSGTFNVNLLLGSDILPNELEFQGDNGGMFCTDLLQCSFNSNELQALSNESQYLVNGGGSSTTPLASEITSLESDAFRNSYKLSSKERKEKIHRYMKKRNERNFSKKIKYACRKTLADSRPRVRGRFAKNDEFGENNRTNSNHEEDTDEDNQHVAVKDEEENFESSDILSQLSGVNSFKCKYSIQSWI
ncbi:zinc finger protein CONSTANS-LIKE 4-like [Cynara cardunculus var. scolymus]|nr:zinc finger protein CONSTANS-LIKE 4-like [Cynara cardunculus var. scolymus]